MSRKFERDICLEEVSVKKDIYYLPTKVLKLSRVCLAKFPIQKTNKSYFKTQF